MSTLNTTNIKHAGNTGDANLVLASDGTSTFNNDVTIDGDLTAAAGTFSDDVQIGEDPGTASTVGGLKAYSGGSIDLFRAVNNASLALVNMQSLVGSGKSKVFSILADGETRIGGNIDASPNITLRNDGVILFTTSSVGPLFTCNSDTGNRVDIGQTVNAGSTYDILQRNSSNVKLWGVTSGGSAGFRGLTIETEPDNPDNFNAEGEYTGPTLDVKQKLLDFVARIEALEATNASLEARLTALEGGSN